MKATTSPRIACRIVRGWVSMTADGHPTTGSAARHVSKCPACQRFFASAVSLEEALRHDARRQLFEVPAGLDTRVMQQILGAQVAARRTSAKRRLPLVFAGAAAAIVAAFALQLTFNTPDVVQPVQSIQSSGAPASAIAVAESTPVARPTDWHTLTAPVATVLSEDPLKLEVQSVYADARSVVKFLALNFLPGDAVAATERGAGG